MVLSLGEHNRVSVYTAAPNGTESQIMIHNLQKNVDRHQKLTASFLGHAQHLQKIISKSVHNCSSFLALSYKWTEAKTRLSSQRF